MMMRRALDIAVALIGLSALSPVILVAMIAVRLSSPGPALFVQQRIGRGGHPFFLYKLRTMHEGVAQVPSHLAGESALTPLGAWLRRWKLDELPQLVNVLRGDMSLVGPRPCLLSQKVLIEARRRSGALDVMPGITGLAQVRRIDMSDPLHLAEIDGVYARTRSFSGDLKLLLLTVAGLASRFDAALGDTAGRGFAATEDGPDLKRDAGAIRGGGTKSE